MDVASGSISTYLFTMVESRPLFLLLLRAPGLLHAGSWQAVHGMIEPGETAFAAAYREAVEESGLTPERFFKTGHVETFYSEHTDMLHLVPAFAAFVADARPAVLSHEHTDHTWCALDDAVERFVFSSQRNAVRAIADAVSSWPAVTTEMADITALVR